VVPKSDPSASVPKRSTASPGWAERTKMWHWVRFRVFQSALVDRLEHLIAVRVDWGPEPFPIKSCMPVEMERWTPSDKVREHPLQPYWPAAAAVVAASKKQE